MHQKISFQQEACHELNEQLRLRHNVVIIGIKRVGISNFLRHFLALPHSVSSEKKDIFLAIDLNNLVEKSLYAFWILTLKKVIDVILNETDDGVLQDEARELFMQSIQLRDHFFTLHALERLLHKLSQKDVQVTLFFLRFDRLQSVLNAEFSSNLIGLRDAVPGLSYVLTSYRPLNEISPQAFHKTLVRGFFYEQYMKPLSQEDSHVVIQSLLGRYHLTLSDNVQSELIRLSGGHVQYLHQSILAIRHHPHWSLEGMQLFEHLKNDESIQFLSEEIMSSLTDEEKKSLTQQRRGESEYVQRSGMFTKDGSVFSPLLAVYGKKKTAVRGSQELSKKEHRFFEKLFQSQGMAVERAEIIEYVWPEESEFGISDWALDRLAARVRRKLTTQNSPYKVVTIIGRGYKLLPTNE